ncbi:MAG TPA: Mur ligase domain-containing protein, partial [Crocinitomicaceae bacterium]|nr:Mur ligase domain-containing protein [Crocinitomicaceae bacterium]
MEKIYNLFLECSGVSTDTRTIANDNLFVCLKGENFNGNKFAQEAISKGAKYVLIDEEAFLINEKTVLVNDCLTTLQQLANHHRKQFNIPIIGITGSNGKTTTKELTAHLLSQTYHVLYTKG